MLGRRTLPRPILGALTGAMFAVLMATPVTASAATESPSAEYAAEATCAPVVDGVTCSQTFWATNSEQTFVVPKGVSQIQVEALGGRGGNAWPNTGKPRITVTGALPVTPGSTLYVNVGGDGAAVPPQVMQNVFGGFNGGGGGYGGGGGGGATDLRLISQSDPDATASLESRLIVAGGRGGHNFANEYFNSRLDASTTAPGGNGKLGQGGDTHGVGGGGGGGLFGGGGGDWLEPDESFTSVGGDGSSLVPEGGSISSPWVLVSPPQRLTISWTTQLDASFVLSSDRESIPTGEAPELTVTLPPDFTADVGFYCLDLAGDYKGFGVVKPVNGTAALQVDPGIWAKLEPGPHQIYAQSDGDRRYRMVYSNELTLTIPAQSLGATDPPPHQTAAQSRGAAVPPTRQTAAEGPAGERPAVLAATGAAWTVPVTPAILAVIIGTGLVAFARIWRRDARH